MCRCAAVGSGHGVAGGRGGRGASHPSTRRLHGLVDELAGLTGDALGGVDDESSEADLVDQLAVLERLRSAVVAVQAATVVRFARARVERELAADVHPRVWAVAWWRGGAGVPGVADGGGAGVVVGAAVGVRPVPDLCCPRRGVR